MTLSGTVVSLGTFVGIYGLLALGLNVKFGYAGLLDFGHVAFFLVGAYTTALLVAPAASTQPGFPNSVKYILGLNLPWIAAIAVAVVVTAVFGLLVALPAIRLREDYLAITLLGVSAVVLRIIQTEGWLANGPRQLRGYDQPFRGLFPLPAGDLSAVLLLGSIVFLFWALAIYQLSMLETIDDSLSSRPLRNGLLAVSSLGVGYLLAKRGRQNPTTAQALPAAGGSVLLAGLIAAATTVWYDIGSSLPVRLVGMAVLAGVFGAGVWWTVQNQGSRLAHALLGGGTFAAVAIMIAALGPATLSVGLFLGAVSVFAWVYGAVLIGEYFDDIGLVDIGIGLSLAVGFFLTLTPGLVGVVDGPVALTLTAVLMGGFGVGMYRLASRWPVAGANTNFISAGGLMSLWIFVGYYFGQVLLSSEPVRGTIGNVLFLVSVESDRLFVFNYDRLVLTSVLIAVAVAYLFAELAANSPYGRALKAIREDEAVAQTLGKNPFVFKIQSMALGSGIAGLAGGLWALYIQSLSFRMGRPRITFFIFLIVIVGGTANNRGVLLGAVLYWSFVRATDEIAGLFGAGSSTVQSLRLMLIGILLVVLLYYRPGGIWRERSQKMEVPGS